MLDAPQLSEEHLLLLPGLLQTKYTTRSSSNIEILKNLNIQQFTDKYAYVIYQIGLGDFVLILGSDIFEHGGC